MIEEKAQGEKNKGLMTLTCDMVTRSSGGIDFSCS